MLKSTAIPLAEDRSGSELDMLFSGGLFFADPNAFNHLLHMRLSLSMGFGAAELERVFGQLVQQRVNTEMTAAARTIKCRGKGLSTRLSVIGRRAKQLVAEIQYNASKPACEIDRSKGPYLAAAWKRNLRKHRTSETECS